MVDTGPAVGLSVVFVALTVVALVLLARRAGAGGTADRWAELNHVVMSVVMVVMIWWPTGAAGTVLQAVVFAVFGAAWAVRASRVAGAVPRIGAVAHLIMNLGMTWMLLIMVLPGGHVMVDGSAGHDHAGHAGHVGHTGTGGAGLADPTPVTDLGPITLVWAGLLAVSALWWVIAAIRRSDHRGEAACHAAMSAGMAVMSALMR